MCYHGLKFDVRAPPFCCIGCPECNTLHLRTEFDKDKCIDCMRAPMEQEIVELQLQVDTMRAKSDLFAQMSVARKEAAQGMLMAQKRKKMADDEVAFPSQSADDEVAFPSQSPDDEADLH